MGGRSRMPFELPMLWLRPQSVIWWPRTLNPSCGWSNRLTKTMKGNHRRDRWRMVKMMLHQSDRGSDVRQRSFGQRYNLADQGHVVDTYIDGLSYHFAFMSPSPNVFRSQLLFPTTDGRDSNVCQLGPCTCFCSTSRSSQMHMESCFLSVCHTLSIAATVCHRFTNDGKNDSWQATKVLARHNRRTSSSPPPEACSIGLMTRLSSMLITWHSMLSKSTVKYSVCLLLTHNSAAWQGTRIILCQVSPESIHIFDFIMDLHSTCGGDWGQLEQLSGLSGQEIHRFIEYAATFLQSIGNYYVCHGPIQHNRRLELHRDMAIKSSSLESRPKCLKNSQRCPLQPQSYTRRSTQIGPNVNRADWDIPPNHRRLHTIPAPICLRRKLGRFPMPYCRVQSISRIRGFGNVKMSPVSIMRYCRLQSRATTSLPRSICLMDAGSASTEETILRSSSEYVLVLHKPEILRPALPNNDMSPS